MTANLTETLSDAIETAAQRLEREIAYHENRLTEMRAELARLRRSADYDDRSDSAEALRSLAGQMQRDDGLLEAARAVSAVMG